MNNTIDAQMKSQTQKQTLGVNFVRFKLYVVTTMAQRLCPLGVCQCEFIASVYNCALGRILDCI